MAEAFKQCRMLARGWTDPGCAVFNKQNLQNLQAEQS